MGTRKTGATGVRARGPARTGRRTTSRLAIEESTARLAIEAGTLPLPEHASGTTGKFLVLMHEEGMREAVKALSASAGFHIARSGDFIAASIGHRGVVEG